MTDTEKFYRAQKAINQIDDFLEYRWRAHDPQDVRDTILGILAEYTYDLEHDITA